MRLKDRVSKSEQSRKTVNALLSFALQEFSSKGYANASTENIVQGAKVTRGALYHHFKNKRGLFYAVFKRAQAEIGRRIEETAESAADPWDGLVYGCRAFLIACADPRLQQIVVIDAPAVLEWRKFQEIEAVLPASGVSLLKRCLQELNDRDEICSLPIDALTHMLSGAMNEAAVWVSQSAHPEEAMEEALTVLTKLLEGIQK